MKNTITYDGSFPGLLTVLYDIYLLKLTDPLIRSRFDQNKSLFNTEIEIITDTDKSKKVLSKLQTLIGLHSVKKLYHVYLSEHIQAENLIIQYCIKAVDGYADTLLNFGNPTISRIEKIVKTVSRESHRMKAFIRFREIKKGHYFAICTPDFDVLPLITKHFKNRYQDQIWTVFDDQRKYGIHCSGEKITFITLEQNKPNLFTEDPTLLNEVQEQEENYEMLWKTYFNKVNIASRKNTKLFIQHMPKRYWKYLNELH